MLIISICRYLNKSSPTSVYLYIEDTSHLFLKPDHLLHVNIHRDSKTPTNIGCRPTSPNAELRIQNFNNIDITEELEQNLMDFSPQTGLWVLKGRLHFHTGLFRCHLKLDGKEQTQLLFLNLLGAYEVALPSPR